MPVQTLGSEELAVLAAYLRQRDFPVGTAQTLAAQRLLWRMAEEGVLKPAADLAPWLAPVFATSPRDLDRFAELYKQWLAGPVPPPPPPPPRTRWKFLGASAAMAPLVVLAVYAWWWRTRPAPTLVRSPTGAGARTSGNTSTRQAPAQPPQPQTFTASGSLIGSDGKRVSGARLLFAGSSSAESKEDGSFSITGTRFEPVLAVHCDYDAALFPLDGSQLSIRMVRKPQPACKPGIGAPSPQDPRPRYQRIRIACSALPFLVFAAWTVYVLWKRVGLRRWRGAAGSQFAQAQMQDSANGLFAETELQQSVQELRRPRPIPLQEIWPEPTVAATVENVGWFTPVYRSHGQTLEYLVLIDRAGKRDHQACFAGELVGRLQARGVYVHVRHFRSDPRTCIEPETGRSVALTDLAARLGHCQVWVAADSTAFFNGFTGRLERWVDLFLQWPSRVLLTPAPATSWGERELRLAGLGFEIVPVTPRGLARIADRLSAPATPLDSYPAMIEDRPARWTGAQPRSSRELTGLSTELRLYLGSNGFRWLAACAEYPMLEWPLTLSLGKALVPPAEFEPLLRKMVRLPWFRRGSMPGWLRSALVAIDPSLRKRVRSLLAARLGALGEQCAERRTATSAVQVAVEREYGRRVEEDEVWLSLLWGREPGGLALPASRLYRYLFHRGLVWMGPRPLALLAAAALLSAGIWLAMGYGIPVYRPPGPQIERIALDIALSQYYDPSYYAASAPSKSEAPADVPFPDWCYRVVQRVLARSITLVSPPATATPVPGMVSQGQGEAGIFAGSGQSLLFQKGRVAPKRSLSVSLEGKLSTGPFPPLPAAPSLPVQGQTIELANTPVRTGTPTPATAKLNVNVFDGARRPFANKVMYTVRDGNQKIFFEKIAGPNLSLQVPFYDNFADLYTVTASANGYQPAGFTPVTVRATNPVSLDLMLIPKNGTYHFVATSLSAIQTLRPGLGRLLEAGAASAADAQNRYSDLLEKQPAALADILNITAALEQIHLPSGTPEDYLQELVWDNTMKQDRFFVWADTRLADQISQAAARGVFAPEPGSGVFQAGATRVYKQIQFGEANVQFAFHERNRKSINGTDCVVVELSVDYYKDLQAHLLLEVISNTLNGALTDPRMVYVLRWIAGRRAGVPEFDPLYTIQ